MRGKVTRSGNRRDDECAARPLCLPPSPPQAPRTNETCEAEHASEGLAATGRGRRDDAALQRDGRTDGRTEGMKDG